MSGTKGRLDRWNSEGIMTQTPLKVTGRKFELVRLRPGYNQQEVDRFLHAGEEEIQRLAAENEGLRSRIEQLESAADEPFDPSVEATDPGRDEATLILARAGEQHALDVEQARARGAQLLEQARGKSRQLVEEAERVRAGTIADLEGQEAELVRIGESLRRFEQEYRGTLQELMTEGLQQVDTEKPG